MNAQFKLMADEMTEEEINVKINKYQKACDYNKRNMETDDSEFWYEDLNINQRMLGNYLDILKIKQGIIQ
jgi:hypothetical protein